MELRQMQLTALAGLFAAGAVPPVGAQVEGCAYNPRMELSSRQSPLDSVLFEVGGQEVKVCYGRPSARGRTMIGGEAAPYGQIWRTGANETTKILTPVALSIGGVEVPAGTYALYTVPGEAEWGIVVNRAHEQWGHERYYTDEIEAQEAGRATAKTEPVENHVETFTIRAEPQGDGSVHLVLEWENTRVRVPIVEKKM
jgi:hypothetical protein